MDPAAEPFDASRRRLAKRGFTTRHARDADMDTLIVADRAPRSGDLVLARIDAVGQHAWLESPGGRHQTLFVGDEVLLAYGNRYAPDYFEAIVPERPSPCHLAAAGGVAGRVIGAKRGLKEPTKITPIAFVGDREGRVLNLARWILSPPRTTRRLPTVAVVGTSMNAGKTTSAAWLTRGLTRSGLRVGAAKVTGTGAGKDLWLMSDAGADTVLDFTDAGHPSTYGLTAEAVERILIHLTDLLGQAERDAIVLEIADGIYEPETAALLAGSIFHERVDAVLFAAGDAAGAAAGVAAIQATGMTVSGVSGVLTSSPLAVREARMAVGLPVFDLETLGDAAIAGILRVGRPVAA